MVLMKGEIHIYQFNAIRYYHKGFHRLCWKFWGKVFLCLPQLEKSFNTASQNCEQKMKAGASQRGGPRAGQLLGANLGRLEGIGV